MRTLSPTAPTAMPTAASSRAASSPGVQPSSLWSHRRPAGRSRFARAAARLSGGRVIRSIEPAGGPASRFQTHRKGPGMDRMATNSPRLASGRSNPAATRTQPRSRSLSPACDPPRGMLGRRTARVVSRRDQPVSGESHEPVHRLPLDLSAPSLRDRHVHARPPGGGRRRRRVYRARADRRRSARDGHTSRPRSWRSCSTTTPRTTGSAAVAIDGWVPASCRSSTSTGSTAGRTGPTSWPSRIACGRRSSRRSTRCSRSPASGSRRSSGSSVADPRRWW